jgi:hypothetical protein
MEVAAPMTAEVVQRRAGCCCDINRILQSACRAQRLVCWIRVTSYRLLQQSLPPP